MKIFILSLAFSLNTFAQLEDLPVMTTSEEVGDEVIPTVSENVEYKYKQEDYFDFTALEVKGELLTPAEIDIQGNRRVRFNTGKHIRRDFDDYIREDLVDIH